MRRKSAFIVLAAAALITLCPSTAFAYIDPGTGSMLLQMALAAVLAGLFAIKLFWKKIVAGIRSIFTKGAKEKDE